VALINAMVAAGVDIIEVGLPYSDPLMDGPDIQAAVDLALRAGTTPDTVLDVVAKVSAAGGTPVVMSYWNPIERYGVDRFASRLAEAGGRGVITPDLTPEEAGPWIAATAAHGLDRIFLVAPSSTDVRITTVASVTSGFLYAASTMGVTGARTQVSSAAPALVARSRVLTDLPIAVGLGVSTGEQAREVAEFADGVIVGSAFVRRILQSHDHAAALEAVTDLASELAVGVRGA
jgi:tryptophan synthase alpha chain